MVSKCPPSTAYFNPLPRKEGDRFNPANKNLLGDFNPLPRKEGDFRAVCRRTRTGDFNPLPRKEGDV